MPWFLILNQVMASIIIFTLEYCNFNHSRYEFFSQIVFRWVFSDINFTRIFFQVLSLNSNCFKSGLNCIESVKKSY